MRHFSSYLCHLCYYSDVTLLYYSLAFGISPPAYESTAYDLYALDHYPRLLICTLGLRCTNSHKRKLYRSLKELGSSLLARDQRKVPNARGSSLTSYYHVYYVALSTYN